MDYRGMYSITDEKGNIVTFYVSNKEEFLKCYKLDKTKSKISKEKLKLLGIVE